MHGSAASKGLTLRVARYTMLTDIAKVLSSTTTTTYHPDTGAAVTEYASYEHKNKHTALPTKEIRENSHGETAVTEFYYPSDLANNSRYNVGGVLNKMIHKGIVKPVLVREKIGKKYVSEQFDEYREENWSGHASYRLAARHEKADGIHIDQSTGANRTISYDRYSREGNIVQYTLGKAKSVTVLWGYNGRYPVARIENATYATVTAALGTSAKAKLDNLNRASVQPSTVNGIVQELRTNLPKAQVTTYTYDPSVGMTSMTDPRGLVEHYGYDAFNRLNTVRDHQNQVAKTYCYSYTGQQVDCHTYAGSHRDGGTNIYDAAGMLLATILSGSTDPNDYAFSSFEGRPTGKPPGTMLHNVEWSEWAYPASIDYYTGRSGLDLMDTEWEYVATPAVLNPAKQYKVSYWYRSWAGGGWKHVSGTFTGASRYLGYHEEMTIDDFMIYPVGSTGVMYIYNKDGSLNTALSFQ